MDWIEHDRSHADQASDERARIVRLCMYFTGDPAAAEDLAQETLLEAWRHAHKLRDPAGRMRWLAAIAHNVCLRWRRSHHHPLEAATSLDTIVEPAAQWNIVDVIEQREQLRALYRALAQVPRSTRIVLVAHYLFDQPQRTIAARLGISEAAVAMRCQRGKAILRRMLAHESFALASDDVTSAADVWTPTQLWCLQCGQHRLLAQLPPICHTVAFRCPACSPDPHVPDSAYPLTNGSFARLIGQHRRPTSIMQRATTWAHSYFGRAIIDHAVPCTQCNAPVAVRRVLSDQPATRASAHVCTVICESCGTTVSTSVRGYVTNMPVVQAFWRQHTRIRTLPPQNITFAGAPAMITRFESIAGAETLAVIIMRDSWQCVGVHPATR